MSRTKKKVATGVDWRGKLGFLASCQDKAEFWAGLSVQVCYSLKEVSEGELKRLKRVLERERADIARQSGFAEDFAFFSEFLTAVRKSPYADSVGEVPPPLSDRKILERLIEVYGNDWLKAQAKGSPFTEAVIREFDSKLRSLRHLFYNEERPQSEQSRSFFSAVLHWVKQFLMIFSRHSRQPLERLKALNSLWELTKRHALFESVLEDTNLRGIFQFEDILKGFDIKQALSLSDFSPTAFFSNPLWALLKKTDEDTETLSAWGRALFYSARLRYEANPEEGLDACLEAFEALRETLQRYSETLYAWRIKAEQAWRRETDYLKDLNALDRHLSQINARLLQLPRESITGLLDIDKEALQAIVN